MRYCIIGHIRRMSRRPYQAHIQCRIFFIFVLWRSTALLGTFRYWSISVFRTERFSTSLLTKLTAGFVKTGESIMWVSMSVTRCDLARYLRSALYTAVWKAELWNALVTCRLTTVWIIDTILVYRLDSLACPAFWKSHTAAQFSWAGFLQSPRAQYHPAWLVSGTDWAKSSRRSFLPKPAYWRGCRTCLLPRLSEERWPFLLVRLAATGAHLADFQRKSLNWQGDNWAPFAKWTVRVNDYGNLFIALTSVEFHYPKRLPVLNIKMKIKIEEPEWN